MTQVADVDFALPHHGLPEADWVDCYQVRLSKPFSTARQAGDAIVKAFPKWTYPALALRQILVSPFGLKGADDADKSDVIGIFPVQGETRDEIIGGIDDKHLDFRVIVQIEDLADGQLVRMATVIKRHNGLGRAYLQLVLPFHKAIIRGALSRLAR